MLLFAVASLIGLMTPSFGQSTNVTESANVASSNSTDTEKRFGFFGFPGFGGGFKPWNGGPPPGNFPGNPGPGWPRPGPPRPEFFDESSLAGRPNQPGVGPQRPNRPGNPNWDRQDNFPRPPNGPWQGGRPIDQNPTVFPSDEEDERPLPVSWTQRPGQSGFPGNFGQDGRPNSQNRPGNFGNQWANPENLGQGDGQNNQNRPGNFGQDGRPNSPNHPGNVGDQGINFGQGSETSQNRPGTTQGPGNSQGAQPWDSPLDGNTRPVTEDTFETSPPSPLFIDQLKLTDPDTQQDPTNDFTEGFFRTRTSKRPSRQAHTKTSTEHDSIQRQSARGYDSGDFV